MPRSTSRRWILIGVAIAAVLLVWLVARSVRHGAVPVASATNEAGTIPALDVLAKARTFHAEAQLIFNLPAKVGTVERPLRTITGQLSGDVKRTSDGTPEFTGTIYMDARGHGNALFADGQIRLLKDRVLFWLDDLPSTLNPKGNLVHQWTAVNAPTLTTSNPLAVRQVLADIWPTLKLKDKPTINGRAADHYQGTVAPTDQKKLAAVFAGTASHNAGLDLLARLLTTYPVDRWEVWIDHQNNELIGLQIHFIRPKAAPEDTDAATVRLAFTHYGETVSIDTPKPITTIDPAIFVKLFSGQSVGL